MKRTYEHCAKKRLHRYVAEFEFRYTNRIATGFNADRADARLAGVVASASPTKRPVGEPETHAEEERDVDAGGTERAVPRGRSRSNRRWRTKPHRGRSGI
jgi:hypothetical protein